MRTALFITCLADALFPDVGKATVQCWSGSARTWNSRPSRPAAARCMSTPDTRSRRCLWSSGSPRSAPYDAIVAPSGSCVGSVRHQHAMIAKRFGSPSLVEQVEAVAAKTYELSEFLVDVLKIIDVGAYFPHRVTYHPTCHSLRMLRVGDKPISCFGPWKRWSCVELPLADQCCGFGGTFAIKNSDIDGHAGRQDAQRAGHGCGDLPPVTVPV